MAPSYYYCFPIFLLLIIASSSSSISAAKLSSTYYHSTCPNALTIIKSSVASAVTKEARMGASLLRLHFHDCFVHGCDASVLLDDTPTFTGEKSAGPNGGLRGFEVIDTIKSQLESSCPGVVSCADILAVAARDSVVLLGGPRWDVLLGRRDATTASRRAVAENIPSPTLDLGDLITAFSKKGLTPKDLVVLSGSHTVGQASCANFRTRIYNESNIDPSFAAARQRTCPSSGGADFDLAPLDLISPINFDNKYFKDLIKRKGLLHSDQQLYSGGSTDSVVRAYASDLGAFRADFADAMIKLGNLSPSNRGGQVRRNCRMVN